MDNKKTSKSYRTLSFPSDLLDEVKKIIDDTNVIGYRNPTEFIVDATRHHLKDTKMFIVNEQKRKDYEKAINIR